MRDYNPSRVCGTLAYLSYLCKEHNAARCRISLGHRVSFHVVNVGRNRYPLVWCTSAICCHLVHLVGATPPARSKVITRAIRPPCQHGLSDAISLDSQTAGLGSTPFCVLENPTFHACTHNVAHPLRLI